LAIIKEQKQMKTIKSTPYNIYTSSIENPISRR